MTTIDAPPIVSQTGNGRLRFGNPSQPLEHGQAALQLIERHELIGFVGLFDRSWSADDNIHTQRLKNASFGAERDKVRAI